MNKKDILECLNKYNFNKDEYIILSGAALVLYGVKDKTSDIDITTTKNLYNNLLENYNCVLEKHIDKNNLDVFYIDNIINFSTNYFDEIEYQKFLGYNVQTLQSIIELKTKLNRDKDKKDIKLIKKYIKNSSV